MHVSHPFGPYTHSNWCAPLLVILTCKPTTAMIRICIYNNSTLRQTCRSVKFVIDWACLCAVQGHSIWSLRSSSHHRLICVCGLDQTKKAKFDMIGWMDVDSTQTQTPIHHGCLPERRLSLWSCAHTILWMIIPLNTWSNLIIYYLSASLLGSRLGLKVASHN